MKHITLFMLLLISSWASAQIISQYVETESGTSPKGLEILNNTPAAIDFSVDNLIIEKGTNGAAPSPDFTIDSGVLQPGEVLVVGTIDMQPAATANSVLFFEKNFTFNGDDALVLKLGTTITDVFGNPNNDPGNAWEANGVSTRNSNIALLSSITSGGLVGFTDPSTRFETINTTPSDIVNGGLDGFGIAPNNSSNTNFELQLLHYADVDGNEESALDAVDEFSALVDFFQNDPAYSNNTLTVTSGDLIIPGPRFFAAENNAVRSLSGSNEPGHLDIAFANAFGVQAAGFGNHEFDQGPGELFDAAFSSESSGGVTFPGSTFPWLSANIDFTSDGDFSGVIGTDGDNVSNLDSQVAKYAVVTVDGETIGLVGAVASSFPDITSMGSLTIAPAPGSSIAQLAAEIQPSVDALKASGVNKIILLAHMQAISIEKQLATLLDGVDIIVAGGSNTRMGDSNDTLFGNSFVSDPAFDETYPFQSTDAVGDPVLVVNVDADYKYLGRLVVEFDNNGIIDLTSLDDTVNGAYASNESMVTSLNATPIPEVVALRDAVQGVISSQFNNVVGFSSVYLDGRRSQVRTQETNLGNLTADANLWYANLLNPAADAGVDISLKNGGGLRTEIGSAVLPAGSNDPNDIVFSPPANNGVSEGHLRATLRFDNGLVRLTLTADELITIIEHGLAEVAPGAQPGRFPQVGGMSFVYDPNQPAGSRLVDLVIDKGDTDPTNDVVVLDNGVNVAPAGVTFNMVTLNFLANGGDSYPFDQLSAPNRINYYNGPGFGETIDFPDGNLANDPGNNNTFSNTGGEQDAVAEYMSTFHSDNASAFNSAETDASQDTRIVVGAAQLDLQVTELFPGQAGNDLTEDWFEIKNIGSVAWVSGTDPDLYYDDESADATTADLVQGITDIQPGESVVVVISGDPADVTTFENVWGEVLDLTNVKIGFVDGSGLGGGGDAVNLWLGDPLTSSPFETASYPDTAANDAQSFDVELGAFSTVGNANGAVATLQLGGDAADTPNIASPGDALPLPADLVVTEIFPGQSGSDLTEDWFEIKNNGGTAWVSGTDPDLYYDDESADATTADLIQGLTDIQPGESVVVLLTGNTADLTTFENVWGAVLDLSNIEIGFVDGAGLGGGGDAVNLWLGDPLASSPFETASYPDTAANDGQSYDVDLGAFSVVGNANGAVETLALGGDAADVPNIGSPGDAQQTTQVQLAFDETVVSVDENAGNVTVSVSPSIAPANSPSVDVSVMMGGSAIDGTHFSFTTTTLNFPSGSTAAQTVTIPIIDNNTDDSSVFFALELSNPVNATLGNSVLPVYILDDDNDVPVTDDTVLDMNYLTSYTVDSNGTAEISKFDPNTQRLYVVNDDKIEIIDLSDPTTPSTISNIDVTPFGASAQSVDVNNGIVAIAVAANVETDPGSVLFTDIDGNNPVQVTVGALPDMLTFTPDGNSVLVANEGQPSQDYTIDPEGSVSKIDVSGGLTGISQANVTEINFNAFDTQEATLIANDVRIFGPGASVSQDLEPEFITITEDNQTAYVACQENNAYAIIDLTTNTVTDIKSFGLKDHSLPENTLDTSDETDFIFDASWPIKGMYMPDGVATYNLGGVNYLITANEGDAREYAAFEEERDLTDADFTLDPSVFTNIDLLELESNLDGINFTNASGDANNDGLFEELHVFGGRSFSIFDVDAGNLVYDSGNDFAHITAADPVYGAIFNASNSNNSFKNRSDNKGVEPENVIVQEIDGSYYAFIILERIGGVMAYDVTNPSVPVFLEYENSRDATPGAPESGDLGPEGIVYVAPENSGTGKALLVLSNEVSATLSIYELSNITLSTQDFDLNGLSFKVYPNPADSILETDQIGDYTVFNLNGQKVIEVTNTSKINVENLSRGIYLIKNEKGNSLKFIKR
ncbi:choice-of-anchor I family protein [Flavobacteriaceae bacterium 14752]|uniref:choice-of-anchor I family protein n=1 Tax=Mesohalobacter salilacus TaxID=2491711 RepID=UPI000F6448B8|nr:T9SS C-terminal target domain-containing protein [Flavobacteriaceae bacterium 14752]